MKLKKGLQHLVQYMKFTGRDIFENCKAAAEALARTCVPKYKFESTIEIHLADTRIRPATEIRSMTLLYYLHQHLEHTHHVFYLIPASEVPP